MSRAILAIALLAGVLGGIQPKINGVLADHLGSSIAASLVNFVASFLAVNVVLAVRAETRDRLRSIRSWPVPRWTFLAGLGGAFVVASAAVSVETIGVAIFSVAFFAGQITAGLVVDRLGLSSSGVQPFTAGRAQAAALALAAVVVSEIGRPVGTFAPLLVGLVVVSGAVAAAQAAANGRIAGTVGDPLAPTAVNVTVGFTALALIVAVVTATGKLPSLTWPSEPWLYVGGFLGMTIVVSIAAASAAIGVFRTTIAMLSAQLVTSFVIDWVVLDTAPTLGVLVGAGLVVAATVLLARSRA